MCCSIQKTNDQRKKFFFRPKNFPSFRLILRFSVSADMKKVCIRLRSAAGKEDARLSSLPTWSGRKKPDFPACRRGREGRNSTFRLADVVGKAETRLSSLPTPSGSRKVKWRFDCPGWKSLCSKREFCPGKDVTVLSFYLNPV